MRPNFFQSIGRRFREARFLSVSLVIHLIVGLALGGVVLFKVAQDQTSFEVGTNGSFLASTEDVPPPQTEYALEFEEPEASSIEQPSTVSEASAIQSLTGNAAFEMNAASPIQTMGSTFSGNLASIKTASGGGHGISAGRGQRCATFPLGCVV